MNKPNDNKQYNFLVMYNWTNDNVKGKYHEVDGLM